MTSKTFVDFTLPVVDASWLNDVDALRYDSDGTGGAALLWFRAAGADSVARSAQDKMRERDSISDRVSPQTALDALAAGGKLEFPRGAYTFTAGLSFEGDRLWVDGSVRFATQINFNPASGGATWLTINKPVTAGSFDCRVCNLGFFSSNSNDKTAISLVNVANVDIQHIKMTTTSWPGAASVGLRCAGRQSVNISHADFACARPIVFAPNVTFPELAMDHFLIEHSELIGTSASYPVIEVEDGACFTNTTFRNLAIVQGGGGIKWVSTTSPLSSYKLKLENMRFEQPLDTNSWAIDLQENTSGRFLQDVTFDNLYMSVQNNGIRLRNAQRITMRNVTFPQTAGKIALDITFVTGTRLIMENCLFNGATITLTNAKCIRREDVTGAGTIEEWVFDSAQDAGAMVTDTYLGGLPFSLAVDATRIIADATFTGFVMVSTSEDLSAIFCLTGGTGTVTEIADPFTGFSTAAGTGSSVNVYHSGGDYIIENKRAVPLTISVLKLGTRR